MPQRPPQPCLDRGKVQRATRRLFLLSDVVTTAMVTAAGYARKRRLMPHDYKAARRSLARPFAAATTARRLRQELKVKYEEAVKENWATCSLGEDVVMAFEMRDSSSA
jgi:hypothetical protein